MNLFELTMQLTVAMSLLAGGTQENTVKSKSANVDQLSRRAGSYRPFCPIGRWEPALQLVGDIQEDAAKSKSAQDWKNKIDKLFAEYNESNSPGCVVGIIKNGRFIYRRGFGLANLEHEIPITPKSAFYIASTSKQFTAMSALLLAAQGKISLDEDIRTYLPKFPRYKKPVTVRHLLTHTSGVRDYLMLKQYAGMSVNSSMNTAQTFQLIVRQKALNFRPGERSAYSNSGYWLLARIVERKTGDKIGAFAKRHIFKPLNMSSTQYLDDPGRVIKNRVQGYERIGAGRIAIKDTGAVSVGPGGIVTTLDDLLRWDQNFYKPTVGGDQIIEQLTSPARLNNGKLTREAPGLVVGHYRGLPIVEHSGRGRGFSSQILRFPKQKFTVIVLFNLHRGPADQRCFDIADICLASEFVKSKKRQSKQPNDSVVQLTQKEMEPLTGTYVAGHDVMEVKIDKGILVASINGASGRALQPRGANRFDVKGRGWQLIFRNDGSSSLTLKTGSDSDGIKFTRPPKLTDQESKQYVGIYYSDELDVKYHVSAENGRLRIRLNDNTKREVFPRPLITMGGDLFSDGKMTSIRFQRTKNSVVTAFRLDDPRITNIRFIKLKSSNDR